MGEDGEVVVGDFLGGGPEGVGGDAGGDPVGAGAGGLDVVVGEGVPGAEADVWAGFSEVDVAGDGDFGVGVEVLGEGVEGELEVFPEVGGGFSFGVCGGVEGWGVWGDVGGDVGGGGDFEAVLGFDVFDVSGFIVDDADLAGVAVAVDTVDHAADDEATGGDGDFALGVDDFPALGGDGALLFCKPCEALADGGGLDAEGEGGIFPELVEDDLVEFFVEPEGEGGGGGDEAGFWVFSPVF